jgi:predicted nucleic acid-binding protein
LRRSAPWPNQARTTPTPSRRRLAPEDGRDAIAEFVQLPLRLVAGEGLVGPAYDLARQHGCSLYDALYLALAQQLGVPLVTADQRLYRQIGHLPAVRWLGAYRAA